MLEPHSEHVNTEVLETGNVGDLTRACDTASPAEVSAPDWREELAAKMQEYRARRKPREPKYPSLELPFEMPFEKPFEKLEPWRTVAAEATSRSSLAVDRSLDDHSPDESEEIESAPPKAPQLVPEITEAAPAVPAAAPATNLIEFPRYSTAALWDELAEPFVDQPRILDAPELVPPQPALGGILLEEQQDTNLSPSAAEDVQLQPASIGRRLLAAIFDAFFVASATALWGWIFLNLTHVVPPPQQLLIAGALIPATLWLGYQYLLLVGAGTTLGLHACRLELVSFDGSIAPKTRRRWRLLASLLSAASLMLGYAWALLDENGLCWHDRITHTYLRVRKQ
jgi:uncharacterized RDD family membrane protein YckC